MLTMTDRHDGLTMADPSIRLFTYKQTHDTGFAPNPFHGFCTLATCKPRIRLHKQVGDWIAGFTSRSLNGDEVGHERLIYLMQVAEKLPFEIYHTDPRFAAKIPVKGSERCIETIGDNIYGRRDGVIFQVPNRSHSEKDIVKDTDGTFALIGTTFAYFGSEPLVIPDEIRPRIPRGQAGHGIRTEDPIRAQAFIDFVLHRGTGIHAQPKSWKTDDVSWQSRRSCG
jgi:hypothetical protein